MVVTKDIEKESVVLVRRDTGEKQNIPMTELKETIIKTLDQIQNDLFAKAQAFRDKNTKHVITCDEFKDQVETGFAKAYWCGDAACEKKINEETKATIRCIPFDQPKEPGKCAFCGKESKQIAIFGRAY